jgi:hypothetical protein
MEAPGVHEAEGHQQQGTHERHLNVPGDQVHAGGHDQHGIAGGRSATHRELSRPQHHRQHAQLIGEVGPGQMQIHRSGQFERNAPEQRRHLR